VPIYGAFVQFVGIVYLGVVSGSQVDPNDIQVATALADRPNTRAAAVGC
jgi:hypothetical protein